MAKQINKYEFLKDKLGIFAGIAAGGSLMAFLMCILPWGSYGWMGWLDFRRISNEKANDYFIDLKLDKDIYINIFNQKVKVDKGTNIKYLAWYETIPERENAQGCLIQTEDGRRGLCHPDYIRSITDGSSLYVYDHARSNDIIKFHSLVYKKYIDTYIKYDSITFEDFDKKYGPAIFASPDQKTGKYIARYDGLDYCYDDHIGHGLLATFSNGHLESVRAYNANDSWLFNFLAPYADTWMKNTAAYFDPGYYTRIVGYGPLHSHFYPYRWLARGVMGVLDILFGVLVMAIVYSIVIIKFGDNKYVSNSSLRGLIFILCFFIYTPYCYYTMELSPNLFCFAVTTFPLLLECFDFSKRCPQCHAFVNLDVIDEKRGKVETKVYEYDTSKDYAVKNTSRSLGSLEWEDKEVKDREYTTHRMEEDTQKVTRTYLCPCCGYSFKETTNEKLGTRHSRETKGVDRITNITTKKITK